MWDTPSTSRGARIQDQRDSAQHTYIHPSFDAECVRRRVPAAVTQQENQEHRTQLRDTKAFCESENKNTHERTPSACREYQKNVRKNGSILELMPRVALSNTFSDKFMHASHSQCLPPMTVVLSIWQWLRAVDCLPSVSISARICIPPHPPPSTRTQNQNQTNLYR